MVKIIDIKEKTWRESYNKAIPLIEKEDIQIGIITLPPHTRSPKTGYSVHEESEEFAYILSGEIRFHTKEKHYTLRKGELMHNSKGTHHYIENDRDEPAKIIWILSPPIKL
jgi:mannose-6-phosphate isomerase-like protein (cupin superfamily)